MPTRQVLTSGIDYVYLIVPVLIVLFGWIVAVIRADSHPDVRRVGSAARRPLPGQEAAAHAEPTLAAGAADESQAGAGEGLAAGEQAATGTGTETGEPAGSQEARTGRHEQS